MWIYAFTDRVSQFPDRLRCGDIHRSLQLLDSGDEPGEGLLWPSTHWDNCEQVTFVSMWWCCPAASLSTWLGHSKWIWKYFMCFDVLVSHYMAEWKNHIGIWAVLHVALIRTIRGWRPRRSALWQRCPQGMVMLVRCLGLHHLKTALCSPQSWYKLMGHLSLSSQQLQWPLWHMCSLLRQSSQQLQWPLWHMCSLLRQSSQQLQWPLWHMCSLLRHLCSKLCHMVGLLTLQHLLAPLFELIVVLLEHLSLLLSQRLLPAHLHVKMPCLMMRVTTACRQMWKHMCQSLPKRSQIHAPSAWRRSKWESRWQPCLVHMCVTMSACQSGEPHVRAASLCTTARWGVRGPGSRRWNMCRLSGSLWRPKVRLLWRLRSSRFLAEVICFGWGHLFSSLCRVSLASWSDICPEGKSFVLHVSVVLWVAYCGHLSKWMMMA